MATQGIAVEPAEIMVTNGSQQGIDYVARLLLDPGDVIVVEGPTYIGAIQVFDAYEADATSSSRVDDDGHGRRRAARRP